MKKDRIIYVLPYEFYFTGLNNVIGGHTSHIIGVIEALIQKGYKIETISDMPVPGLNSQALRYSAPAFPSIRQLLRNRQRSEKHSNSQDTLKTFDSVKSWIRIPTQFFVKLINYFLYCLGLFVTTLRCCKRSSVLFIYYRHNLNGFIPALVSKMTGIPSVVEVNTPISLSRFNFGSKGANMHKSKLAWREKIQYEFSEVISVVSPFNKKWIGENCNKKISQKIIINPNGVNPNRFRSKKNSDYVRKLYKIASNEILLGMSAVFMSYNAIEELVEAFRRARKENSKLRLILIGESKIRGELEEHVRSQKLEELIIFTGPISFTKMGDYYSACDILVSHFNYGRRLAHGCSIKHLEYMAAGKPVVATDIGHVNFAIKHNQNGLLVPHGDIRGYSEAILKLAEDSDLRIKLGNRGRFDAEKCHSWEANVSQVLDRLSTEQMN